MLACDFDPIFVVIDVRLVECACSGGACMMVNASTKTGLSVVVNTATTTTTTKIDFESTCSAACSRRDGPFFLILIVYLEWRLLYSSY